MMAPFSLPPSFATLSNTNRRFVWLTTHGTLEWAKDPSGRRAVLSLEREHLELATHLPGDTMDDGSVVHVLCLSAFDPRKRRLERRQETGEGREEGGGEGARGGVAPSSASSSCLAPPLQWVFGCSSKVPPPTRGSKGLSSSASAAAMAPSATEARDDAEAWLIAIQTALHAARERKWLSGFRDALLHAPG